MFRLVLAHLSLILRREPWFAELWSALTSIAWGTLTYVSPTDMAAWPSMQYLLRIAGDDTWSALSLGLGSFQLIVLLGDYRWLRWGAAVAMCWFWSFMTIGVWVSVPWAPGVAIYAGWIGINVFSILRLLRYHG